MMFARYRVQPKEIQWIAPKLGMKPMGSKRIKTQSQGISPNERDR